MLAKARKFENSFIIGFSIGSAAGIIVYAAVGLYLFGLPFQFLFTPPPLMDTSSRPLDVIVVPASPTTVGQEITIFVEDANNGNPVTNAIVTVTKDSFVFRTETDEKGQIIIDYLGVYTYISISKAGYQPKVVAIPEVPDEWESAKMMAAVAGGSTFGAAIVGALLTYWLTNRKHR